MEIFSKLREIVQYQNTSFYGVFAIVPICNDCELRFLGLYDSPEEAQRILQEFKKNGPKHSNVSENSSNASNDVNTAVNYTVKVMKTTPATEKKRNIFTSVYECHNGQFKVIITKNEKNAAPKRFVIANINTIEEAIITKMLNGKPEYASSIQGLDIVAMNAKSLVEELPLKTSIMPKGTKTAIKETMKTEADVFKLAREIVPFLNQFGVICFNASGDYRIHFLGMYDTHDYAHMVLNDYKKSKQNSMNGDVHVRDDTLGEYMDYTTKLAGNSWKKKNTQD